MATGTIILPVNSPAPGFTCGHDGNKLLFDADADEYAVFENIRVPANFASALVLKFLYSMASNQSGTLKTDWEIYVMAVSDGDAEDYDASGYDSANGVIDTMAENESAGHPNSVSVALSNADSMAVGDFLRIKILRDADDGANDTATTDAELRAVSLEYTTI